jgi:hypothetical protein
MKTKNKKPGMRYLYLACLLLCALPAGAQGLGYVPKIYPVTSQALPSEQQLAEKLAAFYPQTSLLWENSLYGKDRNLLFEAPEGGGIPLGTPVKEAMLFLATLVMLYGIIIRILLERKSYETNK